jgi:quinol-cytochrome oxidoreductase complex cytochrome b subunit
VIYLNLAPMMKEDRAAMLAIGCLIPIATLAAGAVLGSYLGAVHGGYWGAGVGFSAGILIAVAGMIVLDRARAGD